jgi:hypothetical protein
MTWHLTLAMWVRKRALGLKLQNTLMKSPAFNCMLFMQFFPVRVLTGVPSVPIPSSCRRTVTNSTQTAEAVHILRHAWGSRMPHRPALECVPPTQWLGLAELVIGRGN